MRARWQLACLAACSLFAFSSVAAPLSVTVYKADSSQSPVKQGTKQITFLMISFQGTIGNATFTATTQNTQVLAAQDGDRLGDVPYTVTGGTLIIFEVR